jgi:mono/diheme cytochrome c family protein
VLIACGMCVSALVSACGGGGHATASHASASLSSGGALFHQACGGCHTLTGHNDPRHQGGDLRGFHASRAQLTQLASEMPVRRPLTRAQLGAVVRFVMSVEGAR